MLPINYLVYSVNYLISLPITTRTNQVGEYNSYSGIYTFKLQLSPLSSLRVFIDHKSQPIMHYIYTVCTYIIYVHSQTEVGEDWESGYFILG